jgi:hypothetical protein
MASAEELYQEARDSVAGMQTPDLDSETRRIWILIGALSDAFWRRVDEPGFRSCSAGATVPAPNIGDERCCR